MISNIFRSLFLILIFLQLTTLSAQTPDDFVMTYEITPDTSRLITFPIIGTDYTVDTGDGVILTDEDLMMNPVYEYTEYGTYTIIVSGMFNQVLFEGLPNGSKWALKYVEQWGTTVWVSFDNAFRTCFNFQAINDLNAPNLSQVTSTRGMFSSSSLFNSDINHWDVSNILTMEGMFRQAQSFNQDLNNWDVSNVINMEGMFRQTDSFNGLINNWDVSSVEDMIRMFNEAVSFNKTIGDWDVSSVIDMNNMFRLNNVFNQPIGNWDTSNVTNMESMFDLTTMFNQDLSSWDVSSVTTMRNMFKDAESFNEPLGDWDVSNVTDMRSMFRDAASFNQPIENWDVSNVEYMGIMFSGDSVFNHPLNDWDVSNVRFFGSMFAFNSVFNQPLNNWDVSSAIQLFGMFTNTISFNQPLGNWDISNVTSVHSMFSGAQSFNQSLANWNFAENINLTQVSNDDLSFVINSGLDTENYDLLLQRFADLQLEDKVLTANGLAYCNIASRLTLLNSLNWTISNDTPGADCPILYTEDDFVLFYEVTPDTGLDAAFPFSGTDFTINTGDSVILNDEDLLSTIDHTYSDYGTYLVIVSGDFDRVDFSEAPISSSRMMSAIQQWGTTQWSTMNGAFTWCENLQEIQDPSAPDLSLVTDITEMFMQCRTFNKNINHWDVSNVQLMEATFFGAYDFNQPLDNWDTSNVVSMNFMFDTARVFNQNINNWDVSNVTDMTGVFYQAQDFNQPLNNWNTSSVLDMSGMFWSARSFNQPIDSWNVSSVTDMYAMFGDTVSGLDYAFNQPLNSWDVSSVTTMEWMFLDAEMFNQPLDNWDVSNVIDMSGMFWRCSIFDQNIEIWDVSNVTDLSWMFSSTSFNSPLNDWDTSSVLSISYMFEEALLFNQPLDNWDVSNVTTISNTFQNAQAFNQPLNNWDVSNVIWMDETFEEADSFNQPLDTWDVSNLLFMRGTFKNASLFNQDLSSWDFNQDVEFTGFESFVDNSGLDVENYDNLLFRFAALNLTDKELIASNLEYCDTFTRNHLIGELGWTITEDVLNIDCELFTVFGIVQFDIDGNSCEVTDPFAANLMLKATSLNGDFATFPVSGEYTLMLPEGAYDLSIVELPDYFESTPTAVSVTLDSQNQNEEVDFCITATQSVRDLDIVILPITNARPGFESTYKVFVENKGSETIETGSLLFDFDSAKQEYLTAEPIPTATSSSTLEFTIENILPYEQREIVIDMQTFQPPTVAGGDLLIFTVSFPLTDDNTPENNSYTLEQIVVNSFDPNDKLVLQGAEIYEEESDNYLDYIVRFQNTGTAPATYVRIEDTLDEKLDWSTLQIVSASHDNSVQIINDDEITFRFDYIDLPPEVSDPEGSNGYIAFRVKPLDGLEVGDVVAGTASIFFDFNPPIITSTVTTTVLDNLGYDGQNLQDSIVLYPNPTSDKFMITGEKAIDSVRLLNINGVWVKTFRKEAIINRTINVTGLSKGFYIVEIQSIDSKQIKKLVIQ